MREAARRPVAVAVAVSLLLLAAVACGGKKDDNARPPPAVTASDATPAPTPSGPLRIGVTMHPYYSWTANIVAGIPDVSVVAVLPGEVDAGDYQPAPDDIAKIANLDVLAVNGLGHDAFIDDMIRASGNQGLTLINVNAETPTLPFANGAEGNSHTFISFTNAIQQTGYIARELGEVRPALAPRFTANAQAYVARLQAIRGAAAVKLAGAKIKSVVTVHDGYTYLLRELGIELAGVVQPAHGLTPSAAELSDMIALMKAKRVTVVLTEETFPEKLLATLRASTGARVYVISHVAKGRYAADDFERVMQQNADVLVEALVTDPP